MDKELIDQLWQRALREAIEQGEQFTRYRFAKLVAEHERDACAKACELTLVAFGEGAVDWNEAANACAAAIRARST